jgi:hypothetical protein
MLYLSYAATVETAGNEFLGNQPYRLHSERAGSDALTSGPAFLRRFSINACALCGISLSLAAKLDKSG